MSDSYRKALEDARKELADTQRQIAQLEQKTYDLRQTVATLAKLCGEPSGIEEELGFTDAVRTVLRGNGQMTVSEVIDGLEDIGFPVHKQVAKDASVRTVLNRLVEAGEAGKRQRETDNRFVYYSLEFTLAALGVGLPRKVLNVDADTLAKDPGIRMLAAVRAKKEREKKK